MRLILLALACLLLGLCVSGNPLEQYEAHDIQREVVEAQDIIVVIYHGIARDENEELTGKVKLICDEIDEKMTQPYGIQVKTVDCLASAHKTACRNANIAVMPTVHIYADQPKLNPYTKKIYRTPKIWDTRNPNDIKALEKFVSKMYPNLIQRIDIDEDDNSEATSGLQQLQEIVASNDKLPVTLLFTEKKITSMLLKSVAVALQGRMTIVEVTSSVSSLINKYKVAKYPTFVTIPATPSVDLETDKYIRYDEHVKLRSDLLAHLTTYASVPGTSNGSDDARNQQDSSIKKVGSNIVFTNPNEFSLDLLTHEIAWILAVSQNDPEVAIPDWNKIKKSVEGSIAYAELRCNDGIESDIAMFFCRDGPSTALPYIVMLPFGEGERRKLSTDSVSKWKRVTYLPEEVEEARKAAGDSLPDTAVVEITDDSFSDFITEFLNKKLLPVTVISDKATPSSMLKNLGLSLAKYVKVSFMSAPSAEFLNSLGNPRLPAVIATHFHHDETGQTKAGAGGTEISMALYDSNIFGPMRYHSIQNFALQIYSRSGLQGDGTGPAEPMQDSVQSSEVQKEITVINTPEDWERECSKSYRGICVLAFFDSSSTTYDLNYMSTVMNSIISKMGKSVAAFRMLAADAYCQVSYTDMFGVSATSVPTVSIYSPMKGRYASFRGAFKEQTVQEFLDGVLNGRISTGPLSQRPVFSSSCEGSDSVTIDEQGGDDSDSSELLEEIKREEAARKLQLKKELEEEKQRIAEEKKRAEEDKASSLKKKKKNKKNKKKASNNDEL